MMSYYGGIGGVGWDKWTSEQGDAKSTYDTEIGFFIPTFYLSAETESAEMQNAASMASMLELFFLPNCAHFWALDAHRLCNC